MCLIVSTTPVHVLTRCTLSGRSNLPFVSSFDLKFSANSSPFSDSIALATRSRCALSSCVVSSAVRWLFQGYLPKRRTGRGGSCEAHVKAFSRESSINRHASREWATYWNTTPGNKSTSIPTTLTLTTALLRFLGGGASVVAGFCIWTNAPVKCRLSKTVERHRGYQCRLTYQRVLA
jgi:hypothetical protein